MWLVGGGGNAFVISKLSKLLMKNSKTVTANILIIIFIEINHRIIALKAFFVKIY